eukprot:Selendium_serpulae@DN4995_c1_g1_i2.p1
MNFVSRATYQQEFSSSGVREVEKDSRTDAQKEEDKLKDVLPEFRQNDPNFRSLYEQLEDNRTKKDLEDGSEERPPRDSDFAPAPRTEEEDEFLSEIQERQSKEIRKLKDDEEQQLVSFRAAQSRVAITGVQPHKPAQSQTSTSTSSSSSSLSSSSSASASSPSAASLAASSSDTAKPSTLREAGRTNAAVSAAVLVRKKRTVRDNDASAANTGSGTATGTGSGT